MVYVLVYGNLDCYKFNVWVVGGNLKVKFLNFKNGFSVEVKLKKMIVWFLIREISFNWVNVYFNLYGINVG